MNRKGINLCLFILIAAMIGSHSQAQPFGLVSSQQKISATQGGFSDNLNVFDYFGSSAAWIGDLDDDGRQELAVGARLYDAGATDRGAIWILYFDESGLVADQRRITHNTNGFGALLGDNDYFGNSLAALGDLDGDGVPDIAVGSRGSDEGGSDRGAVWIIFLNADGTVKNVLKIGDGAGGLPSGLLANGDNFGTSVAALGDVDGDGIMDLAVGAERDNGNGNTQGAAWILLLNSNGSVKQYRRIADGVAGFPSGALAANGEFGSAVAGVGDFDGNGVPDLVVGNKRDNDGGGLRGAIWVVLLETDPDLQVAGYQKISSTQGGFTGVLDNADFFGSAIAPVGDLDGDGVLDLAVGAIQDDDGVNDAGAVWLLFMKPDGTVKEHFKISQTSGGFAGPLDAVDQFGWACAVIPGTNQSGTAQMAVGANGDDDGFNGAGAVWILNIEAAIITAVSADMWGMYE